SVELDRRGTPYVKAARRRARVRPRRSAVLAGLQVAGSVLEFERAGLDLLLLQVLAAAGGDGALR
ncbi:MAG TPA: hypothetical protein VEY93_00605, partial [Longimicrobium sp.]|nr:hypothetical protein [Longimicrobium sp.]